MTIAIPSAAGEILIPWLSGTAPGARLGAWAGAPWAPSGIQVAVCA